MTRLVLLPWGPGAAEATPYLVETDGDGWRVRLAALDEGNGEDGQPWYRFGRGRRCICVAGPGRPLCNHERAVALTLTAR